MKIHYEIIQKHNDNKFNVITFTLSSGDKIIQKYVDKQDDYLKKKIETFFNFGEKLNKIIFDKIRYDQLHSGASSEEIIKWLKVNTIYHNVFNSDKKFHVIELPTGAGKTANFVQWLLHFIEYTANLKLEGIDSIIILAPNYDNAIDEITNQIKKFVKFNTDVIILEGKWRTCIYNPKNPKNKNNPDIDKSISKAIETGLSIKTICEKDDGECKENCKYYNDINNIKSKNGIKFVITTQHQLTKTLPILMKDLKEILIVIDENFEDAIRTDFNISLNEITDNIKFLKEFIKNEPVEGDLITVKRYYRKKYKRKNKKTNKTIIIPGKWIKSSSYKRKFTMDQYTIADLGCLLDLFEFLKKSIEDGIDYDKLKRFIIDILEFNETLTLLNRRAWFVYKKNNELPLKSFLFYKIKDYIDNYLFQKYEKSNNLNNWLKNSIVRIDNTTTNSKYLSFKYFEQSKVERVVNSDKIIKILNTDATANIKDIEILFNHKVEQHYLAGLYSNTFYVYQIKQKSQGGIYPYALFSKRTMNSYTSFNKLKEDIKETIDVFPDIDNIVLLSMEMEIRHYRTDLWEYLKRYVSPKLVCEPFGLASTNRYENNVVAIALGTPLISSSDNEREARLLGRDPIERGLEKASNKMKQGLGRLFRKIHDVYLFILSGLDLKFDFDIKEIFKYQELRGGRIRNRSAHYNWVRTMRKLKKERKEETENRKLINFIKKNNRITVKECSLFINKSEVIAKNTLIKLVNKGILDYKKEERGRHVFFIKDKLKEKLDKYIENFVKSFIQA